MNGRTAPRLCTLREIRRIAMPPLRDPRSSGPNQCTRQTTARQVRPGPSTRIWVRSGNVLLVSINAPPWESLMRVPWCPIGALPSKNCTGIRSPFLASERRSPLCVFPPDFLCGGTREFDPKIVPSCLGRFMGDSGGDPGLGVHKISRLGVPRMREWKAKTQLGVWRPRSGRRR